MKKYFIALLLGSAFFFHGCVQEGSYKITGNLNLPDGAVITLWPDDNSHQIAGTSSVRNEFTLNIEGLDEGVYNVLVSWPDPNFWETKRKNGSFIATPDSLYSRVSVYLESKEKYHITSNVRDYKKVYAANNNNLHPYPLTIETESPNTKDLQQIQAILEKTTIAYQIKMDSLNFQTKLYQDKNDIVKYEAVLSELQTLDKNFYNKERFKATKAFIDSHPKSAVSAYLIATAPNLKENKKYFENALLQLDPSLSENRYIKEAKRRIALN